MGIRLRWKAEVFRCLAGVGARLLIVAVVFLTEPNCKGFIGISTCFQLAFPHELVPKYSTSFLFSPESGKCKVKQYDCSIYDRLKEELQEKTQTDIRGRGRIFELG